MKSTIEHDVISYLRDEADRVRVSSTLEDIGLDVKVVSSDKQRQPARRFAVLAIAAAAVLVVWGLAAGGSKPRENASQQPAGAPVVDEDTTTLAATTTTMAPNPNSLPAGATLNGVVPQCTSADSIVFECAIEAFPEDLQGVDYTGYTSWIIDDTSHVSGGCRSTNSDATHYLCYVGQRAVDEGVVSAESLGSWAPIGYSAG